MSRENLNLVFKFAVKSLNIDISSWNFTVLIHAHVPSRIYKIWFLDILINEVIEQLIYMSRKNVNFFLKFAIKSLNIQYVFYFVNLHCSNFPFVSTTQKSRIFKLNPSKSFRRNQFTHWSSRKCWLKVTTEFVLLWRRCISVLLV